MKKALTSLLILMIFMMILGACTTPAGRTAGQVIDDATITTKVKAKLYHDSILEGMAIGVKTFSGKVVLTGAVDTPEQKMRAEEIARSVYGVKSVHNLLEIKKQ